MRKIVIKLDTIFYEKCEKLSPIQRKIVLLSMLLFLLVLFVINIGELLKFNILWIK